MLLAYVLPLIWETIFHTRMICALVQSVIVYKYIIHNPNIMWYVDN
jgi:hypothetical protein